MDRQSIIGLVIIAFVLIGYTIFTKPSQEEREELKRRQDSIMKAEKEKRRQDSLKKIEMKKAQQENDTLTKDSTLNKSGSKESSSKTAEEIKNKYGVMSHAARGESEIVTLENEQMIFKLNTKGGKMHSVELKDYKTHNKEPLILFEGDTTVHFGLELFIDNRPLNTNDLHFEYLGNSETIVAEKDNPAKAVFRLNAKNDRYIDFVYTLKQDEWIVDYDVRLHNMNNLLAGNVNYFNLQWRALIPGLERGRKWETQNSTIQYRFKNSDVDKINERKDEDEVEADGTSVDWVAYKQQFFSSILMYENGFNDPHFHAKALNHEKYIERFSTEMTLPYMHESDKTYDMQFYFGPNKYQTLKSFDKDLEELLPLGWGIFGWFNKFLIIPVFNWLGNWFQNYGIIILLLTLMIKLILFPLTYKSYMSTAKMRVLKPQIEELSKKYPKGKEMEKQQATMNLYKKAGANPMGGCLPMLLQLPILIAMFRFFPASIELRQKSFLWADDLSSYDSILDLPFNIPLYGDHISLFTLLMAGSMVISTKLNSSGQAGQNQSMMKMMMYFMPIMLLVVFNSYAAGLSYYYFLANLITITQTWVIRKFIVDDEAVMAKLEANKKKPKKKSKWQQKLEEAQKQQQKRKR